MDIIEQIIMEDNIIVKNTNHKRCIELFYPFMNNFTENPLTIKELFQKYVDFKLTTNYRETACFNGRYDNGELKEPYEVHLYIQFDEIRINLYYVSTKIEFSKLLANKVQDKLEYNVLVLKEGLVDIPEFERCNQTIILNENDIINMHTI